MTTYFHIARESYSDGEDLLSWDSYIERYGEQPCVWKWEDADEGFDTDIVSLFSSRDEADAYMDDFGGVMLHVTIPDWAEDEGMMIVTNSEGYTAVMSHIPAAFVSRA